MPTEAFLQLKESKKNKLIDAAVEEFSSLKTRLTYTPTFILLKYGTSLTAI